jgi:hypothetical protein
VLAGLLQTRLARNAVHSELIAAHRIAAADVPQGVLNKLGPRLHHRRHTAQYAYPQFYFPLALFGAALELFNLGQHGLALKGGGHFSDRVARIQRLARADKMTPHPNKL